MLRGKLSLPQTPIETIANIFGMETGLVFKGENLAGSIQIDWKKSARAYYCPQCGAIFIPGLQR
jgi:hypothetical protein